MRNLRYYPLLHQTSFSLKEHYLWMRMPSHYLAESVHDFEINKRSLRHSFIQRLYSKPILYDFAMISLNNMRLDQAKDQEKNPIYLVSPSGEKLRVVKISDEIAELDLLWPDRPNAKIGFNEAHISQGFNFGNTVYRLNMLYHLKFHDSFIYEMVVSKPNSAPTDREKRILSDIIEELHPLTSF